MTRRTDWTAEQDKKLKLLWEYTKLSASQIAAAIPDKTRNAVIGRTQRLKLKPRRTFKRVKYLYPHPRKSAAKDPYHPILDALRNQDRKIMDEKWK